jgi:hypothetical protein
MMLESGERERERENGEKVLIAVWPLQWPAARHSTTPSQQLLHYRYGCLLEQKLTILHNLPTTLSSPIQRLLHHNPSLPFSGLDAAILRPEFACRALRSTPPTMPPPGAAELG